METSNNKLAVADVVLVAENNVDYRYGCCWALSDTPSVWSAAASTLKGSNFADSIKGGEELIPCTVTNTDTLEGGGGADFLNLGGGNNIINDAGNGADIILHDEGSSAVIYNTEQIQLLSSLLVTMHM